MKLTRKNKYLALGIILMLFLSYKLALLKTLEAKKEHDQYTEQKKIISNVPGQLSILRKKEAFLDQQLEDLDIGNSSAQNSLLKVLGSMASKHQVKIIDFNSPHITDAEKVKSETYIFELEGGFANILRAVHSLENAGIYGEVIHWSFEKQKEHRTRKEYLRATIFLEQHKY